MRPAIAIALVSKRPWMWESITDMMIRQIIKPSIICFCVHSIPSDKYDLTPFTKKLNTAGIATIDLQCQGLFGQAMHWAMEALDDELSRNALLCKIDDDDFYGSKYFSDLLDVYEEYPLNYLYGKHGYWTVWMDAPRDPIYWEAPVNGNLTRYLAGPTLTIPLDRYRMFTNMRYDEEAAGSIDAKFINKVIEGWQQLLSDKEKKLNPWPPICTTGPDEFLLQRWINETHGHIWRASHLY